MLGSSSTKMGHFIYLMWACFRRLVEAWKYRAGFKITDGSAERQPFHLLTSQST